ncbi:uncharacterized protein EV422DRAFT_357413 [Fimicolochytrium jonesii]|uniref:uncharacterized protein n=1 Tax=Fimicolochytrium jonesii TaxID=1396493 RepID=UPI0022FE8AAD|nr:uncharacterized protein EV422DRAFT_357413 [Fimicolochytrium jonesii]KAI8823484.1 hypothetical protein EV422DRAFT_357413 [Fimicolochytrium jonesii]
MQCCKETKAKDFRRQRTRMREGIAPLESNLPSAKGTDSALFDQYLHIQHLNAAQFKEVYREKTWRRLRLRAYSLPKSSAADVINQMKALFGMGVVVVLGNWNEAGRTMKFQISPKTTGFRKIFKRTKIKGILPDEFRTSSLCFM